VRVPFDRILVAVGRRPNVEGFGLEELGVRLSERGTVETDGFLRTNIPNIFCAGDVAGPYQFTHTAGHQAWYASVNALFGDFKKLQVDYRVIPWATFTDPEVARVGLNETEARQQNIAHEVTLFELAELDRAIAEGEELPYQEYHDTAIPIHIIASDFVSGEEVILSKGKMLPALRFPESSLRSKSMDAI
jgi:pyruvate/2-oxoglutarate dehydrogenase complex dihydrolipoamide dehydrogenase (E3) component